MCGCSFIHSSSLAQTEEGFCNFKQLFSQSSRAFFCCTNSFFNLSMGSSRYALALAIRSLRQRSAHLPLSSAAAAAALPMIDSRPPCIGPCGTLDAFGGQHSGSKVPWGTAWVFAAAGLVTLSSPTTAKATAPTVLEEVQTTVKGGGTAVLTKPRVVFVLGGPGSGKGTQCAKIVDNFGFVHLSAGDLLRAEIKSGSENGTMIQNMIKEGRIVPSEVTVKLLQKAMEESKSNKFLIDGFPRNEENRASFERVTGIVPEFILFFDCPEEEMERRILGRNQGRVDDNIETIRKRFKVFIECSIPVVNHYDTAGKVHKIIATRSIDDVFTMIEPLFKPFVQDDLLRATEELLQGIDSGDYSTYQRLCHSKLTAFEPESQGQLVEGLEFHKFYFDLKKVLNDSSAPSGPSSQSTIVSPKVSMLGKDVGITTYTRLQQIPGGPNIGFTTAHNETRIWERKKNGAGEWEWKNVHFHRSNAPTV